MYFLHIINNGRQTRLLNVLGQTAMILGDKKNYFLADLKKAIIFLYINRLVF